MSSSVSLLPTAEFLEAIALSQFSSDAEYAIAFSTVPARFFSTTNSEWVCLNSESELLGSRFGTAIIEPDFAYTRPESSPRLIASNQLKIPDQRLNAAQSLFLYRSDGETEEIIFNSNFNKQGKNQTTAPLLDCFSRECMSWFNSDVEWFTGLGELSKDLSELTVDEDGIITTKSEDIYKRLIEDSTQAIAYTSIQFSPPNATDVFVSIQFGTGVEYSWSKVEPNVLFLFNSDSLVAFAGEIKANNSIRYDKLETQVYFDGQEVIII